MIMSLLVIGVSPGNALKRSQSELLLGSYALRELLMRSLNGSPAISLMNLSLPMRCSLQSANPVQFAPLLLRLPIEECMELSQEEDSLETSSIEFSQS